MSLISGDDLSDWCVCGAKAQLTKDAQGHDMMRCPMCGEEFYTFEQADALTVAVPSTESTDNG